jgi:hypothetical protein
MASTMSKSDQQEFDFDVKKIVWSKFLNDYYFGTRKYLGKDNAENWPALRRRVTG